MRSFIKWLGLVLVLAYAQLFTLVWLNAYTFGYRTTIYLDEWGEANLEGLVLFGVLWSVVSVGLYFLARDGGLMEPRACTGTRDAVDPVGAAAIRAVGSPPHHRSARRVEPPPTVGRLPAIDLSR